MKNYWSQIKKDGFYIYCGKEGFEIKVVNGKPQFHSQVTREAKKDAKEQLARLARVAKASYSEDDYKKLNSRIEEHDWEHILNNDLTGDALRNWAFNTPTSKEYYNLLRYN